MVFTQKKRFFHRKMASQGAGAWGFNAMKCNSEHPDSGSEAYPKEAGILSFQTCARGCLTLEERETMGNWKGPTRRKRESGETSLAGGSSEETATKKGNKSEGEGKKSGKHAGGKWFPPYCLYAGGRRPKYDLGPERKDAWELVLDRLSEAVRKEVEEKEETESEEEKGRIWRKVRGVQMLKSRGGKNKEEEKKEFGDICNPKGVKPWTDTQIEDEATVDSESSSETPDTQMSGETMKEPEICNAPLGRNSFKSLATDEMKEGEKMPKKKKRRAISDAEKKMGFVPYGKYTYGEVFLSEPEYAKFLIEEGRRNNMKGRFTHWAMGSMVDAFLEIGRDEPEGSVDSVSERRRQRERMHERRE